MRKRYKNFNAGQFWLVFWVFTAMINIQRISQNYLALYGHEVHLDILLECVEPSCWEIGTKFGILTTLTIPFSLNMCNNAELGRKLTLLRFAWNCLVTLFLVHGNFEDFMTITCQKMKIECRTFRPPFN